MFEGAVDFGGTTFVSVPPADWDIGDGYVAKLSTTGHHQWSLVFGSDGADSAEAVAVDGADDVVVVGFFEGTVDLGGSALVSIDVEDVLLGKLDSAGQHLWSRSLGGAGHQFGRDVAVDGSGNIAVIGHFDGSLDAGGSPLVAAGMHDAFLVKLTPTGTPSWSLRWGGVAHDVGWRVAVDAGGNVFAAGRFEGQVDFGTGLVASAGAHDLFLVKVDPNGQHLFSRRFGGSAEEHVYDLAVDSTGAVIITGATRGSVDFGGGPLCGAGGSDAFLVKLDSAGSHLWSQCFGTMGDDSGTGVTTDGADNIVLTGVGGGQLDFGGGSVSCQPAPDVAMARFTSAGEHLHSACYGGPAHQMSTNVALDPWENILLGGNYRSTLDLGSGELDGCAYDEPDHPEGSDVFVAKLVP